MVQATTPAEDAENQAALRKAVVASFIGNFVEWFDYGSYAYLAATIGIVFFNADDPATGLLGAFAVFAVSFVVRPIGGIIWGHYGDKIGRKEALSASILIMSGSTFCIGLIPSYVSIGIWAPILLFVFRLVQGFSAAGEYAGAAAFIAEYAPDKKRGFYTAAVPASTAAGLLFGSLMVALLTGLLSHESLISWGWRIPFLLAAPLGLIGLYIRLHLEDTPKFLEMAEKHEVVKAPFMNTLVTQRKAILIAFGVTCLNAVGFYTVLSYMPTYLSTQFGLSETHSFVATTFALLAYIGMIFFMGRLSDAMGRKRMLITAGFLFLFLTIPLFHAYNYVGFVGIILIQIAFGAMLAMNDGTLATFLSEIFPTDVRYTGFAFSFNTANALFGGTTPAIAVWLISVTGNQLAPGWVLMGAAVVALIAMFASTETAGEPLKD